MNQRICTMTGLNIKSGLYYCVIIMGIWIAGCSGAENTENSQTKVDSVFPAETKRDTVMVQREAPDSSVITAQSPEPALPKKEVTPGEAAPKNAPNPSKEVAPKPVKSLEETMQSMGLVNIRTVEPTIKTDLKYTTTDNFMGKDAYGDLTDCYLQKDVAEMLKRAQKNLQEKHKGYHFIVYDGARPFTVQKKMWDIVKGTDKAHYVAKPDAKGSMHNYGCAVDLSVVDDKGVPLDMGTAFDHLGTEARTDIEADLLKQGKITQKQLDNRLILREAMEKEGFKVLKREWWHFNAFPDSYVLANFKKIP